jgi:hypothetical protein
MISQIPTPNASVDASGWPLIMVRLSGAPSDEEYRLTLGRLRALRARRAPHAIIIDARLLDVAPNRSTDVRITRFLHECNSIGSVGAAEVIVLATLEPVRHVFSTMTRTSDEGSSISLVPDLGTALARAVAVLETTRR